MSISQIKRHSLILFLGVVFVPSVHAQTYFDSLAARSDVVIAVPFRSQAELEAHWLPNNHDNMFYDSAEDAVQLFWPKQGGGNNIDQLRPDISPDLSSGNVFVTWEDKWGSEWVTNGSGNPVNGIGTHKNFQYSDDDGGGLQLEVRLQHRETGLNGIDIPAGRLGSVDIRSYFGNRKGTTTQLDGILTDILLDVDVWARYFLFIEYGGNGKISLWVTQEGAAPQAVYLQATGDSSGDPGPFRIWWFEHNSSQSFSGSTARKWVRNFVVLDGVANLTAAHSLVVQGSLAQGGEPVVRPAPPVLSRP